VSREKFGPDAESGVRFERMQVNDLARPDKQFDLGLHRRRDGTAMTGCVSRYKRRYDRVDNWRQ